MQLTDKQIGDAASVIGREANDFTFGKPDERDFVRMVCRGANVPVPTDDVLDSIADELYEDMGETVQSARDMARFIGERLPNERVPA